MPDFNIRADSVNIEQIMEQIRARIREKRGVDYTEDQIRELAAVKLEKFLDPRGIRSDLLEQYRRTPLPERPNYAFEDDTMFETHRGFIRFMRRLLNPILKLFFNPNPLIQALHIQSQLNTLNAEREAAFDQLYFELVHNLVLEITRLGVEVKNLKMRVESLGSRVEFNERRARALESVVVYKPSEERDPAAPIERSVQAFSPPPARSGSSSWQGRSQGSRGSQSVPSSPTPVQTSAAGPEQTSAARDPGRPLPVAGQGPSAVPGQVPSADSGPGPDGPGQRSRRRRRRRGRRGGGSATAIMGQPPGEMGGHHSVAPPVGSPSPSAAGDSGEPDRGAAADSTSANEHAEESGPGGDEPDGQ